MSEALGSRRCPSCGARVEDVQRCQYCGQDLALDAPIDARAERVGFESFVRQLRPLPDEEASTLLADFPFPRDCSVGFDVAEFYLKLARSQNGRRPVTSLEAEDQAASAIASLKGRSLGMTPEERIRLAVLEKTFEEVLNPKNATFHTVLGLSIFLIPAGLICAGIYFLYRLVIGR
jgi:hypothetical protein